MVHIKKKNIIIASIVFIIILLLSYAVWYFTGDKNLRYLQSLPQFHKVDMNARICVNLNPDDKVNSVVDCFIPAKISEYLQGMENSDKFLSALKDGYPMAVENLEGDKKSVELQFVDMLQPSPFVTGSGNYLKTKAGLEKKIAASPDVLSLKNYAYLTSLEGDYQKTQEAYAKLCKLNVKECKALGISVTLTGTVSTASGQAIEGATVSFLGTDTKTTTDKDGKYNLVLKNTFTNQKLRATVLKKGMSNGSFTMTVLAHASQTFSHDFVLETPLQFAVINTVKNTISGTGTKNEAKDFVVTTTRSTYKIPHNALIHRNGKPYKGEVTAYFFEFDKSSHNQDLLENDVFDGVVGYAGNLMKTFGMPYVLFITEEGEVIHVAKDNAMSLTYQIPEMEALRTNKDKIYEPLTDADMQLLMKKSSELGGYPIDREFLIANNLLRFPAFWIYDQTKGTWVGIGIKILDAKGLTEMPFYTLSSVK